MASPVESSDCKPCTEYTSSAPESRNTNGFSRLAWLVNGCTADSCTSSNPIARALRATASGTLLTPPTPYIRTTASWQENVATPISSVLRTSHSPSAWKVTGHSGSVSTDSARASFSSIGGRSAGWFRVASIRKGKPRVPTRPAITMSEYAHTRFLASGTGRNCWLGSPCGGQVGCIGCRIGCGTGWSICGGKAGGTGNRTRCWGLCRGGNCCGCMTPSG